MSKTATLNVTLSIAGDGRNDQDIPLASFQSTNSPGDCLEVPVASAGNYTVLLPQTTPLASYAVIVVPAGITCIDKGVPGDTGYNMGVTGGLLIKYLNQSPPGSFVLNLSAPCTLAIWYV